MREAALNAFTAESPNSVVWVTMTLCGIVFVNVMMGHFSRSGRIVHTEYRDRCANSRRNLQLGRIFHILPRTSADTVILRAPDFQHSSNGSCGGGVLKGKTMGIEIVALESLYYYPISEILQPSPTPLRVSKVLARL